MRGHVASNGDEGLPRPSESDVEGERLLWDVGDPCSSRISIPGISGEDSVRPPSGAVKINVQRTINNNRSAQYTYYCIAIVIKVKCTCICMCTCVGGGGQK